ncbi:MAG: MarR family transcriptional regulator [Acidimicrobiia bacterium]
MGEPPPPLLPIFRSENQLRLLGHLFLRPEAEHTIADLEAATGIPQQTLSREVARLAQAGIIRDRRQGRTHLVAANQASPYFPELAGLLLKALGPREALVEELAGLAGIREAYIFGSWARRYHGEAGTAPGDIDVVVVGETDVDAVYEACRRASRRTGQEVNPVVLTAPEWEAPQSGFLREVRAGSLVPVVPRP